MSAVKAPSAVPVAFALVSTVVPALSVTFLPLTPAPTRIAPSVASRRTFAPDTLTASASATVSLSVTALTRTSPAVDLTSVSVTSSLSFSAMLSFAVAVTLWKSFSAFWASIAPFAAVSVVAPLSATRRPAA